MIRRCWSRSPLPQAACPGGNERNRHCYLSAPAPAGGIFITLASGNNSVAQVPPIVAVAGGQTSANFTVAAFPVSNTTVVTITAFWGSGVETVDLTVTKP